MPRMNIRELKFSKVYPMYVRKAKAKGRTREELDELIRWLTGFSEAELRHQIERETDFETFFGEARLNPNAGEIKGVICGYRVEEIEDPVERKVRMLDKIIDELAKGKALEKIKRG